MVSVAEMMRLILEDRKQCEEEIMEIDNGRRRILLRSVVTSGW